MDCSADFMGKIVLAGPVEAGKTNLMVRFANDAFISTYKPTNGVDFLSKPFQDRDKNVTFQIWDTAGAQKFQSIAKVFYRGARVVVIVFDLSNQSSFEKISEFFLTAKQLSEVDTKFILVGNKLDLTRAVAFDEAKAMAQDQGALYLEASAKDGTGVNKIFEEAFGLVLGLNAKETQTA